MASNRIRPYAGLPRPRRLWLEPLESRCLLSGMALTQSAPAVLDPPTDTTAAVVAVMVNGKTVYCSPSMYQAEAAGASGQNSSGSQTGSTTGASAATNANHNNSEYGSGSSDLKGAGNSTDKSDSSYRSPKGTGSHADGGDSTGGDAASYKDSYTSAQEYAQAEAQQQLRELAPLVISMNQPSPSTTTLFHAVGAAGAEAPIEPPPPPPPPPIEAPAPLDAGHPGDDRPIAGHIASSAEARMPDNDSALGANDDTDDRHFEEAEASKALSFSSSIIDLRPQVMAFMGGLLPVDLARVEQDFAVIVSGWQKLEEELASSAEFPWLATGVVTLAVVHAASEVIAWHTRKQTPGIGAAAWIVGCPEGRAQ